MRANHLKSEHLEATHCEMNEPAKTKDGTFNM